MPRIVALIAAYNEGRFIGGCLDHLHAQGVATYLLDNGSTDDTVAIAERRLGGGLIAIESVPRADTFRWRSLLGRKEELATQLDADWFLHVDADEILLPPAGGGTLATALAAVDAAGDDAIELAELTFVPTRESPDHDHPGFRRTMRWYYPFLPSPLHLVRGWKRGPARVALAASGGHVASFPDRRLHPHRFRLCHYLFLGVEHAREKYERKRYDPAEVRHGWHGWRPALRVDATMLPRERDLRRAGDDDHLDTSSPRTEHCFTWSR
jgi:glycosyltransferase involved in cell wall biosynthesis